MSDPLRVVLADDHTLLRDALRDSLEVDGRFRVEGEAADVAGTVDVVDRCRPAALLLDLHMPGGDAFDVLAELRRRDIPVRVVVISMHCTPDVVERLVAAGAHGYVHKSASRDELVAAVRAVCREDPTRPATVVPGSGLAETAGSALSPREAEVLALVARARSNQQIARELLISPGTVKRHLASIFEKLGAVSRLDAVNRAAARRSGGAPARPAPAAVPAPRSHASSGSTASRSAARNRAS